MTDRCSCTLHPEPRPDRPAAVYRLHVMPCHSAGCEGRICAGHLLCPECVAAVRDGRIKWADSLEDVEVVLVASR